MDLHELTQVVNTFSPLVPFELNIDYKEELVGDKYFFTVTVNEKTYDFEYVIDLDNEKAQIKFVSKNSVYDALSDYTGKSIPWGSHTGVRPVSLVHDLYERYGEDELKKKLKDDFRISDSKIDLITNIASVQRKFINKDEKNIDIYISIPFCVSRCTYCSFSIVGIEKKKHLHEKYVDALCMEIERVGKEVLAKGYVPRCVYVGGGTPTAIKAELLKKVLDTVNKTFTNLMEFTVEAGRPDTITKEKLQVIKDANVTRISINPQSMNQKTLDIIGRKHKVEDIVTAYNMAREFGFDNINMDVIAGLPNESFADFKYTLDEVFALSPESITVHTFALKRSSALKKQNYHINDDDSVTNMLDYAYELLSDYTPYYLYRQKNMEDNGENVGFSLSGKECVYNIDIMEENTHILALGSGGVSKRIFEGSLVRRSDPKDIEVYLDRIEDTIEKSIEFF